MDKRCNTCMHFNIKGDYSGYCMNQSFLAAAKVSYTGNSKHHMPCRHDAPWLEQKAEIEKWAEIRINGDVFGCIFHEKEANP